MKTLKPLPNNLSGSLDFIRGLAVFLVVFSHLDNFKMLVIWPLSFVPIGTSIGALGVNLFFILSGYLIWASAKQTLNMPNGILRYTINRLTRIYPLYLICIVFIVLLANYYIADKQPVISFDVITRHLLFLQSFSPDVSVKLNAPFWSLTHEFLFYLLVPILYFFKPSHWVLMASIVVTQLLFSSINGMHNFVNYWCLFAAGMLIQQQQKILGRWLSMCVLALMLGLIFIDYEIVKTLAFVFAFSIVLFSLLLSFEFKNILFKPMIGLGVISYSVYVWHYVLIHLISPYITKAHVLLPPIKPWLPFGFAQEAFLLIVFILLFSTLSYYLIEKPSMTTLRKKLSNSL